MNKLLTAIALSIALPAVAHAQAAPQPKADCCEKMKAEGKDCSKDMAKMDHSKHDMKTGANPHAGHDMSQAGAQTPQADTHPNHQH